MGICVTSYFCECEFSLKNESGTVIVKSIVLSIWLKSRLSQLSVRTLVVTIPLASVQIPWATLSLWLSPLFRISKEDHEAYVATLDQEAADLEKALATSADEHAKLVAAKQAQEMLLVEHLTNLNISTEAKGETNYRSFHFCLTHLGFTWRGRVSRGWLSRGWRDSPSDHRWARWWWRGRACDQGRVHPAPAASVPCPR